MTFFRLTGCITNQTFVCTDPQISFPVKSDCTRGVGHGFVAGQKVLEGLSVISVDSVKPRADPDIGFGVLRKSADVGVVRHSRKVFFPQFAEMEPPEAISPATKPNIALAIAQDCGGVARSKSLWLTERKQRSLAPTVDATAQHSDPQTTLIVDIKGTDRVIRKAIVGRPRGDFARRRDSIDSFTFRANPE